jgi:glycosyltransferase involved in cell wall biosynthesis
MNACRKYLYLIVTDYPYGIGEPFLEIELKEIAIKFEKVYIIIPEAHKVNHHVKRYRIPHNTELIEFSTSVGLLGKIKTLFKVLSKPVLLEREFVTCYYGQKFTLHHLKTLLGFLAMAESFGGNLNKLLRLHGHAPNEVSLYSYWLFYPTAALSSLKEKNAQYRVISRVHGWDCFFERSTDYYLPLRPWIAKTIDGIYAISEIGKVYLQAKLGHRFNHKIYRSYLGVEDLPHPNIRVSGTGKLHIVSIAFIDPVKQLNRIVDALAIVNNINVKWTHIGNSPNDDPWLRNYAIEKLGNKANIEFLFKGELTKSQVFGFLKNEHPDLLICTSKSEGLPVSMMEAMGHGIGVLSVDVGGVSEIVKDGFNGALIPLDARPETIAEDLVNWSNLSTDSRIDRGMNAYQTYIDYFSAKKNFTKFIEEALNE